MNFYVGDNFIFEEIKVKVITVKQIPLYLKFLKQDMKEMKGLMEVPKSYLKEKKDQIRRCS